MKTQDAIQWAGSATALADLLTITPSAVSQWDAEVPQPRVWQLKVLRPDWFDVDGQPKAPPTSEPPQPNASDSDQALSDAVEPVTPTTPATGKSEPGEHANADLEAAYVIAVQADLVTDRRHTIRRKVDRARAEPQAHDKGRG